VRYQYQGTGQKLHLMSVEYDFITSLPWSWFNKNIMLSLAATQWNVWYVCILAGVRLWHTRMIHI